MILRNKRMVLWIFGLSLIFAAGCETTAGLATGVASTATGAAKDTMGLWHGIQQADNWFKENLW